MEWDSKLKDFFVSNEDTKLAVCNLCNKSVSFKTTSINLIQHLALAHHEALLNTFPVVISNEEEELSGNGSLPVVISCDSWSFFETVEGSTTAKCALCLQNISFKTSHSNLEQHLKIKHAEVYKNFISSKSAATPPNGAEEGKKCEKKVENSLDTDNGSEKVISELVIDSEAELILQSDEDYIIISSKADMTKRKHTSPVWKVFDRIPNTEMATCTLCRKIISYKSTRANLKSHIRRIHPVVYNIHFLSKSATSQIGSEEINSDAENSHLEINSENEHMIENNMLNSSKFTRQKRSDLWNFFDKISNTQTAKCNLCQRIISYKSTRANLKSHLRRLHPLAYEKQFISSKSATPQNGPDKESDLESNNSDEEKSLGNKSEDEPLHEDNSSMTIRKNRSDLWNFFDRIPNTQMATCTLCQKNLSYKTTTNNLRNHLIKIHSEAYNLHFVSSKSTTPQNSSEEKDSDPENSDVQNNSEDEHLTENNMLNSSKITRRKRSDLWNFFDRIPNTKAATCNVCQKIISYRSTRAHLISHIKRIHPVIYYKQFNSSESATSQNGPEEETGLDNNNSVEEKSLKNNSEDEHLCEDMFNSTKTIRKNRSDIWNFFDKIPNSQMATCTLCQKNLSYRSSITHLRNHLKKLHPMFYHSQYILSQSATAQNGSEEGSSLEEMNLFEENSQAENNSEDECLLEDNMINSSKITRRNRNRLSNFFDRIPNTETAMCTLCQKIISYRSTSAHLISHIKRIHPSVYYKNVISKKPTRPQFHNEENNSDEENFLVVSNSEDEHVLEDNMLKSSKITTRNRNDEKDTLSKTVSAPQCGFEEEKRAAVDLEVARTNRFDVWKVFDRIRNTKIATCTLCQRNMSYKSTTGNLRSHIKRLHPETYFQSSEGLNRIEGATSKNEDFDGNNSEEEYLHKNSMLDSSGSYKSNIKMETTREYSQQSDKDCSEKFRNNFGDWTKYSNSAIFNFFERNDKTKMFRCKLCQNTISYKIITIMHLKQHLKDKHKSEYLDFSSRSASSSKNIYEVYISAGEDQEQDTKEKSTTFNFDKIISDTQRGPFDGDENIKEEPPKKLQRIIKSEYLDFSSRSASPSKNIYEVYISAGEDQEQDTKEKSTTFNFDKIISDTQRDPFDGDENIKEEPPKKLQRISSINWAYKIQPDEKKNIDRYLLKLITEDFQPFSIVEDKGFQEFIAVLNPNYQLPTQKTLSTLLTEEYTSKLGKFKEITHSCSSVSLSVDCWSSRNMQSFMTVTAHFINPNTFEFYSVLIQSVGHQDTAQKIATQLRQVTSKWGIINKVKFIVFDDAPNMVSAARILNWPYFTCFANKFNSIVQGALNDKSIAEIVAKVQKAVAYFKRNSAAKEMLHEYQVKTQQVVQPKSLMLAIPTCWITVCKMLKRFSELQDAVCATSSNINEEIPAITSDEWQCINQLVEILKPFEEAATIMSSEKYLIAGKAVVLMAGLYKLCSDLAERSFCEPVSNLVLKLKNDLSSKFGDFEENEEISVCTLLDPRFKQHAFEDHIAMLNAKECVLVKLKHLNNGHSVDRAGSSSTTYNTDSSLLGRFYTKVASSYQPEMSEHRTVDELNRYLSENVIPPTECSLRWWKERRMLYPGLSKIFVACSNIVVTSLPCDRAFSKTGYLLSDRLNGLTTSKVDQIMFLHVNK